jgi:hypothetical protein
MRLIADIAAGIVICDDGEHNRPGGPRGATFAVAMPAVAAGVGHITWDDEQRCGVIIKGDPNGAHASEPFTDRALIVPFRQAWEDAARAHATEQRAAAAAQVARPSTPAAADAKIVAPSSVPEVRLIVPIYRPPE